ncbi:unnamed protein product [Xylocopa violacea]|uniref:Transmembrane protein 17 n=1 Tax=Xylocopa violacea TaxID=135666 RepID=A0ABP1PE03_XYLVO
MLAFTPQDINNQISYKSIYPDCSEIHPNLPLQITLYLNLWFSPGWLVVSFINLTLKYDNLTDVYKLISVAIFLVFTISEFAKLYLGYLGNLAGRIPELASCWVISILIELPLVMFLLFDQQTLSHRSEKYANCLMICFLLTEIITGMIALKNLADKHAKVFYLMHLYTQAHKAGLE